MAQRNDELSEIMAQSRIERQALLQPVGEISRRLQPANVVDTATRYAKRKASRVVAGVSETVKENGGVAAMVAVGAVAMFETGRRSAGAGGSAHSHAGRHGEPEALFGGVNAGGATTAKSTSKRSVSNLARTKAIGGALGGVALGHVIGRAFQPSAKERDLFGKASNEIQTAASEFVSEHARGAKIAAAQAFGFARYAAAFLAIMAGASDYFARRSHAGERPTKT